MPAAPRSSSILTAMTPPAEVLLPVLRPDGTTMSEDDAVNQYIETGKALGHFGSPEEADQFAESRAPRQKVTLPAIDFSL
jgi:hypothetical protein